MGLDLGHCLWPFTIPALVLEEGVQYKLHLIGGSAFFFLVYFAVKCFGLLQTTYFVRLKRKDDKSHLTSPLP